MPKNLVVYCVPETADRLRSKRYRHEGLYAPCNDPFLFILCYSYTHIRGCKTVTYRMLLGLYFLPPPGICLVKPRCTSTSRNFRDTSRIYAQAFDYLFIPLCAFARLSLLSTSLVLGVIQETQSLPHLNK